MFLGKNATRKQHATYGEDSSCGTEHVCRTTEKGHSHDEHHDDTPTETCEHETKTCWYDTTTNVCNDIYDYHVSVPVRVNIDPEAKLLLGEEETLDVHLSGSYSTQLLRVSSTTNTSQNSRFVYDFDFISVDLPDYRSGDPQLVEANLILKALEVVKPRNNVEITSFQFIDENTLAIELNDVLIPAFQADQLKDVIYKFKVKKDSLIPISLPFSFPLFSKTYIDGEVRLGDMDINGTTATIVLTRDSTLWRRNLDFDKAKEYRANYWVKRLASAYFVAKFSKARKFNIKIEFN